MVQQQNVLYEQDYLSPHVVPVEGEMQDILSRERSLMTLSRERPI